MHTSRYPLIVPQIDRPHEYSFYLASFGYPEERLRIHSDWLLAQVGKRIWNRLKMARHQGLLFSSGLDCQGDVKFLTFVHRDGNIGEQSRKHYKQAQGTAPTIRKEAKHEHGVCLRFLLSKVNVDL